MSGMKMEAVEDKSVGDPGHKKVLARTRAVGQREKDEQSEKRSDGRFGELYEGQGTCLSSYLDECSAPVILFSSGIRERQLNRFGAGFRLACHSESET